MMENFFSVKNLGIAAFLFAAVYFDLRTRKVPNQLILVGLVSFLIILLITDGLAGYSVAFSSIGTMLVFILPLYLLKAIGGGDFKLLFVFSILSTWYGVMTTVIASLVWGSLLGLTQSVLSGQSKQLFQNIFLITVKTPMRSESLHKIPYTVAILLGWMTDLSLKNAGVRWL